MAYVERIRKAQQAPAFTTEGMDNGSFAIASNKKELKVLMKSDAAVMLLLSTTRDKQAL